MLRTVSVCLAAVLLVAAPPPASAQDTGDAPRGRAGSAPELCEPGETCPDLSLVDVRRQVVRSNPEIRALQLADDRAAATVQAARSAFDPTVVSGYEYKTQSDAAKLNVLRTGLDVPFDLPMTPSVIVDYRRGLGKSIDPSVATTRDGETSVGLSFSPLGALVIDAKRAKLDKAQLEPRRVDAQQAQERNRLLLEATEAYWKWVKAHRTLQIQRDQLALATRRLDIVARRARTGEAAPIDTTEARLSVVSRRESVVAAERAAQQAAVKLATFLWTPGGEPAAFSYRPPDSLSLPTVAEAQLEAADSVALAQRPKLRELDVKRQQTQIERRLARGQRLPDLKLKAQLVSYENGPMDVSDVKVGFEIDQPLFFRRSRSESERARVALAEVGLQQDVAARKVQAQVQDAVVAYRQAWRRVEAARERVTLAERLQKAEQRRFEIGESTLFLLAEREQALAKARTSLVAARTDVHRAYARLQWATGRIAAEGAAE